MEHLGNLINTVLISMEMLFHHLLSLTANHLDKEKYVDSGL